MAIQHTDAGDVYCLYFGMVLNRVCTAFDKNFDDYTLGERVRCDRAFRRGVGYERLAADGPAGAIFSAGICKSSDRHSLNAGGVD